MTNYAQLLISLDKSILPAPPPSQPVGQRQKGKGFDHVLFSSQLDEWRRIARRLMEYTSLEDAPATGQEIFDRHQRDCQRLLGAALSLQSRARATRRRARERPAERSKDQRTTLKDIQLYSCALKEMVEPQNWASADLPLAIRRTFQRLGMQRLTVIQAKFLRILPWWRRRILQALEQSRETLAALSESQRKVAATSLRKRYHWLFEIGKKGVQ
jgi:hypothetical protein